MLERVWGSGTSRLLVIGLNPSTADAYQDDATIRRCVSFAETLGAAGLLVGNLFAARSTSPQGLRNFADPVGLENDAWLGRLQRRASRVVVAWGNGGRLMGRNTRVLALVQTPYCFGITKLGEPRHPLYLPASVALRPFTNS